MSVNAKCIMKTEVEFLVTRTGTLVQLLQKGPDERLHALIHSPANSMD